MHQQGRAGRAVKSTRGGPGWAMRTANHDTQRLSMAYARDHPLERHLNWADEIIFYGRGGLRSNTGDAEGG